MRFRIYRRIFVTVAALAIALIAGFFFARYSAPEKPEAPFYGLAIKPVADAYDFHLIDQNGNPFRLSQLRGKVVLFSFGYVHCPDVCPTTLTDFAEIYRALPEKDRNRVQILFISVDPQRDRPETLKEYIGYFDPSFVGLTGNADQIKATATAYGAAYTTIHPSGQGPEVYFVNHSTFAYLISPNGKLRMRYLFDQLRYADKIAADIERLSH
jgi:protein SCO1/2